jgi:hypothetical protein
MKAENSISVSKKESFGIEEGSVVPMEEGPDGAVMTPAATLRVEAHTPEGTG